MIQLVSKTAMLHRLLLLLSLHLLRCSGATSQEDQTTWKGGANQHNVRKKARKVERSRVLFPQCQIWIVSANKRGWHYTTNQTSEHQPPNIRKSLASHHRKQKDEGRYQPCVILAWKLPSKRMSQVFLLSWGGMAETYLCKYRGIAWSPNSWWDPANWPYPPNKRHWTSQPANKLIHDGTKISLLFSKLKSHIICQSFSKQNSFCQAIVEAPFGPSGGPGGATVGIVPSPDAEWTSSDASRALWTFEIVCKVNPIKHLRYDTMYTYRTIYIHMYIHKFDLFNCLILPSISSIL